VVWAAREAITEAERVMTGSAYRTSAARSGRPALHRRARVAIAAHLCTPRYLLLDEPRPACRA